MTPPNDSEILEQEPRQAPLAEEVSGTIESTEGRPDEAPDSGLAATQDRDVEAETAGVIPRETSEPFAPAHDTLEDKLEPGRPRRKRRLGAIVAAATLTATSFLGGALVAKSGNDGSSADKDAAPAGLATSGVGTDKGHKHEAPTTTTAAVESQNTVEIKTEDVGDGFIVPAERPKIESSPPEIESITDTDKILSQLSKLIQYASSTGDSSVLDAIVLNPSSDFAKKIKSDYEQINIARQSFGINDLVYYNSLEVDPAGGMAPATLNLAAGEKTTVPVRSVRQAYGGDIRDLAHFTELEKFDLTLIGKVITNSNGTNITVPVIFETGPAEFQRWINNSSLFKQAS